MRSYAALNVKSFRCEHHGALIRVEECGQVGYGCIHPWPELGDLDLDQTLTLLASGKHTRLSSRALFCARMDAEARIEKRSLFDGLQVPKSHATLMMDQVDFQRATMAGFKTVKVKVGRETANEVAFIREMVAIYPQFEWRLDFNGAIDGDVLEQFLADLGEDVRQKIDFIEDAYSMGTSPWVNALGPYDVPMAVDREIETACGGFGVAVVKPAVNVAGPILERALDESKRVVMTSYMDHPLGQTYAAWEAAKANQAYPGLLSECGLVTHGLFETDAFTEYLGEPGPEYRVPSGTGLGFDHLLQELTWTPLN